MAKVISHIINTTTYTLESFDLNDNEWHWEGDYDSKEDAEKVAKTPAEVGTVERVKWRIVKHTHETVAEFETEQLEFYAYPTLHPDDDPQKRG